MKLRLIPNWRESWRWSSVRLAWIFASAAAVLTASQTLAIGLLMILPSGPWRYVAAGAVGLLGIGIPWLMRVTRIEKKESRDGLVE